MRTIDKSKKSNRKCEHCKHWSGWMTKNCTRHCKDTNYYNTCKEFEWNPKLAYKDGDGEK